MRRFCVWGFGLGRLLLTNLNNPIASLQTGFDPWPGPLNSRQECRSSAIPQADPDDSDFRLALLGEIEKVFVLADDDALFQFGIAANVAVKGIA